MKMVTIFRAMRNCSVVTNLSRVGPGDAYTASPLDTQGYPPHLVYSLGNKPYRF